MQYGALDINYDISSMGGGEVGEGVAQDFGFGYNLGFSYEITGMTIGAVYKSSIEMEYDGQLTSATAPFVEMGAMPAGMINDVLEQPAEIGIGASWNIAESANTIAFDYKQIQWGSASGYSDFGWDDQDVVILGYEYAADIWAVRLGYNYAEQPIKEQSIMAPGGATINMFNLLGFPATTESHYSIGGTYVFSKDISLDLAYAYAPETTTTFNTAMPDGEGGINVFPISVKHSQSSVSFGLNYTF